MKPDRQSAVPKAALGFDVETYLSPAGSPKVVSYRRGEVVFLAG
jgi:hypothetical protein